MMTLVTLGPSAAMRVIANRTAGKAIKPSTIRMMKPSIRG
jgi:hypothetical protein